MTPEREDLYREAWMATIKPEHRFSEKFCKTRIYRPKKPKMEESAPPPAEPVTPPEPEPPKRRHYTADEKSAALKALSEPNASISAVAQKLGIQANTLAAWRHQ